MTHDGHRVRTYADPPMGPIVEWCEDCGVEVDPPAPLPWWTPLAVLGALVGLAAIACWAFG